MSNLNSVATKLLMSASVLSLGLLSSCDKPGIEPDPKGQEPEPKLVYRDVHARLDATPDKTSLVFSGQYDDTDPSNIIYYYKLDVDMDEATVSLKTGTDNGANLPELVTVTVDTTNVTQDAKGNLIPIDEKKPVMYVTADDGKFLTQTTDEKSLDGKVIKTYVDNITTFDVMVKKDNGLPVSKKLGPNVSDIMKNVEKNSDRYKKDRRAKFNIKKAVPVEIKL